MLEAGVIERSNLFGPFFFPPSGPLVSPYFCNVQQKTVCWHRYHKHTHCSECCMQFSPFFAIYMVIYCRKWYICHVLKLNLLVS